MVPSIMLDMLLTLSIPSMKKLWRERAGLRGPTYLETIIIMVEELLWWTLGMVHQTLGTELHPVEGVGTEHLVIAMDVEEVVVVEHQSMFISKDKEMGKEVEMVEDWELWQHFFLLVDWPFSSLLASLLLELFSQPPQLLEGKRGMQSTPTPHWWTNKLCSSRTT